MNVQVKPVHEERRRHDRVALLLHCRALSGIARYGPVLGLTENISRGGLLLHWRGEQVGIAPPAVNDPIRLAVEWPSGELSQQRYLCCGGRVVRIQSASEGGGHKIAVKISRAWFS